MVDLVDSWSVLLGWPAVGLSVLVAAALVGPISAYLALTPRFFVWGLFPVGVYLVAAVATRWNHRALGAALVAANAAFFGWLAVTIFG